MASDDLISNSTRDLAVSSDAMRWTPTVACQHEWRVDISGLGDRDLRLLCEGCGATWTEER